MKHIKYHQELGATVACTNIMAEATKMIGQKYRKGATKDCFIFDSWLSSKNSAESEMEVGSNLIGMVKTKTKLFFKETNEKLTRYWTGCSYLMLRIKHMVPRVRSIIAINYNYNVRKVLIFIVTDNTGIKQLGLTYLSKYPDQFYNISIHPVAQFLGMYNFFGYVNEFDSRNKKRQYYMALENFWVTQCFWI